MVTDTKQMDMDAEIASRVDAIEKRLAQIDTLRTWNRRISLLGVLLILTLLTVAVYRMVENLLQYRDEQKVMAIFKEANVMDLAQQEANAFKKELDEVVPDFARKLTGALEQRMPDIEKQTGDMIDRLQVHAAKHVEERLLEALVPSLERNEEEIKKILPEFDLDELKKNLERGQQVFTDRLTEVLEEKIAFVEPALGVIAARASDIAAAEQLDKQHVGEIERGVVDTLVDLIVYELKPELGNEPAVAPQPAEGTR